MPVRITLLRCGAAGISLGVLAGQQAATIKEQQSKLVGAEERIKATTLAQQEKCANQARKWFVQQAFDVNELATYENHYNVKLNQCVASVERKMVLGKVVYDFMNLVDVMESRPIGIYVWHTVADRKYEDVPPTRCTVTAASGEAQQCQSADEFKKLAALYMKG